MILPRPFTNVFKNKPIYRGSDWVHNFALRTKQSGVVTPMNLDGNTIKMTIKPPLEHPYWITPIVKEFSPINGNEFELKLTSAEQMEGIFDFETSDTMKPIKASIEVTAYNGTDTTILIRDDIMVYSTVRSDD